MAIGPWKDTIVPPADNYLEKATDLIAKAHALGMQVSSWPLEHVIQLLDTKLPRKMRLVRNFGFPPQVHPYTYRNENSFLHFDFHQDPYVEYDYWINKRGVDGLFTDFTGSLHRYQEWTSPSEKQILQKIASIVSSFKRG